MTSAVRLIKKKCLTFLKEISFGIKVTFSLLILFLWFGPTLFREWPKSSKPLLSSARETSMRIRSIVEVPFGEAFLRVLERQKSHLHVIRAPLCRSYYLIAPCTRCSTLPYLDGNGSELTPRRWQSSRYITCSM